MSYSQDPSALDDAGGFAFFSDDLRLQQAAQRAQRRIETAIGPSGLVLAEASGFRLSFADAVYCFGNPDPALACTSTAGGGKTLAIQMQAELSGDELDNRLIHELFHVITRNQAQHSPDGLFMEYSVGDERITRSTLESVCAHFPCATFVLEEERSAPVLVRP
jgi:hypothetical protein